MDARTRTHARTEKHGKCLRITSSVTSGVFFGRGNFEKKKKTQILAFSCLFSRVFVCVLGGDVVFCLYLQWSVGVRRPFCLYLVPDRRQRIRNLYDERKVEEGWTCVFSFRVCSSSSKPWDGERKPGKKKNESAEKNAFPPLHFFFFFPRYVKAYGRVCRGGLRGRERR